MPPSSRLNPSTTTAPCSPLLRDQSPGRQRPDGGCTGRRRVGLVRQSGRCLLVMDRRTTIEGHGLRGEMMTSDRLKRFAGLCASPLPIALALSPTAVADNPSWNGQYAITFMVGPKAGTSMAVGNPEVQHTETYGLRSSCTNGKCVATIVSGPRQVTRRCRSRFSSRGMESPGRKSATFSGTA